MPSIIPIIRSCGGFRVGIRKLWLIDGLTVSDISFDGGIITGLEKSSDWAEINFEINSCSLREEKKRIGNSHIISQKIEFSLYGSNQDTLTSLESLNRNGTIHALLYCNDEKYRYVGIDIENNVWQHTDLRTSDGKNNTGAGSEDISELTESLMAISFAYAPFANESISPLYAPIGDGLQGDDGVNITGDDGNILFGE